GGAGAWLGRGGADWRVAFTTTTPTRGSGSGALDADGEGPTPGFVAARAAEGSGMRPIGPSATVVTRGFRSSGLRSGLVATGGALIRMVIGGASPAIVREKSRAASAWSTSGGRFTAVSACSAIAGPGGAFAAGATPSIVGSGAR
ncbi:MAG: hypothetical protein JWP97_6015, partial [Labilithrix sp.]|nr:hypothetical protein [Labilithrix sp.]